MSEPNHETVTAATAYGQLTPIHQVRRPLSWRAEWVRELGRRRTQWIFGVLLALPLILVAAFALDSGPTTRTTQRPIDLATSSGANFTMFALLVSGEFLLFIVGALLVGDPVPAEASWSSLRYLLTAPVRRARLLTSKLVVGFTVLAIAIALFTTWSLLVGSLAYGAGAYTIPGGGQIGWADLAPRLAITAAYQFICVMPIAAIAFWVGVRTDTPLAAVGGALVVFIVSGILDSIDAIGSLRNALPGHDVRAWTDLFTGQPWDWTDLRQGTLWSLLWTVVFLWLGYRHFGRKDVLS